MYARPEYNQFNDAEVRPTYSGQLADTLPATR